MKKLLLMAAFLVLGSMTLAQMAPGDIAIVGMGVDDPDDFTFVALVDIPEATEIIFTDCGWLAAGTFRAGEGAWKYTAPGLVAAGTVVYCTALPPYTGTIITGTFALSTSGDQIIAFQGTDQEPSLIYAINNESTEWQTDATSANTSALPVSLTNASVAMNPEVDNVAYSGITTGTKAELLAAINNPVNWTGNDASKPEYPTSFTLVTGVEGQPSMATVNFSLLPCLPNPANKNTKFSFSLSQNAKIELSVFNVLGQKVAALYKGNMSAGSHSINWNLKDDQNRLLPNGVYFYQLTDGSRNATRRLLILK